MHDGLKIAIGASATALLAWTLHGPLGQGDAFLASLKGEAGTALAQSQPAPTSSPTSSQAPKAADAAPSVKPAALPAPVPGPTSKSTAPSSAPVAATQRAPEGSCQAAVDTAVNGRVLSFRSGSAWLNPTSLAIITDVAAALKHCKDYTVEVAGHTDNVGDEGVNRIMSQERAKRVRDGLAGKGIPASALTAKGYGSSHPIAGRDAADPANRRITFTVTGGRT